METLHYLFGEGENLTVLQMSARAVVTFIICILFIRIAGMRSFGMRMPFDTVITILLGAILSRPIVGASPFLPSVVAAGIIALMHRLFAWIAIYSRTFGKIIKGEEVILYENGKFFEENMRSCLISMKDLIENVRLAGHVDSFEKVKIIYVERNGEISIVKKEE
jgi:uncharacterized membrane protein YcaP (DUF421 family)